MVLYLSRRVQLLHWHLRMRCLIGAEIWFLSYVEMGLFVNLGWSLLFVVRLLLLLNLALVRVSFKFLVLLYAIMMLVRSPGSFSLCFLTIWCSVRAKFGLDG